MLVSDHLVFMATMELLDLDLRPAWIIRWILQAGLRLSRRKALGLPA
jgi:hypothetical protein